ncbi:hypothetical protein [Methanothermococcus okinawensis]|uniref:Uncharacterized protein n=1 Tax=Methanothermococcus okinawensis (strain DSM 14208 / JCM 11175 / IH1) TaxID=647113 RepID=F8AKN3_METOI|nr:hypothetical protein [Methanothermococcus okinawensis]AEH06366.1 hypothetical protein Metok_0377 [Methanothermococcus okinawensis IH1]
MLSELRIKIKYIIDSDCGFLAPFVEFEKVEDNEITASYAYYYPEDYRSFVNSLKLRGFEDNEIEKIVSIIELCSEFID